MCQVRCRQHISGLWVVCARLIYIYIYWYARHIKQNPVTRWRLSNAANSVLSPQCCRLQIGYKCCRRWRFRGGWGDHTVGGGGDPGTWFMCIYIYTHIIHMHACIHYIMLRRVALHCIASHHVTLHYIHTWYMQCTCIYIYDVSAKGLNDQNLLISPMPCPAHSGRNNKQFKRFWGPPPELPQGGAFTIWMLGKTPNPPE